MAPKNESFRTAYYRVRFTDASTHISKGEHLLAGGDEQGALVELLRASEIDPSNEAAQQEIAKIRARHSEEAPVESPGPINATTRQIWSRWELRRSSSRYRTSRSCCTWSRTRRSFIRRSASPRASTSCSIPTTSRSASRWDLNNVTLLDALRIVGTLSATFWRPITQNTIFVAANTRSKRAELDDQAIQTFYLSNAWQQNDLNDVQTALRNVMPNAKVYGVASQNALVMRATPDELLLAQKLISDLDKARPEVVVDIAGSRGEQELGAQSRHYLAEQRECADRAADDNERYDKLPHGQHELHADIGRRPIRRFLIWRI